MTAALAPSTHLVPPREQTARRLLAASANRSYDPRIDVAWDQPWADDLLFVPEDVASLAGTDLWAGLSLNQRVEVTRCELANSAAMGIWFELTFFPLLVDRLLACPADSDHLRYGLTEIADECRHSAMFSTLVGKLERGPYPFNAVDYGTTKLLRRAPLPAMCWVAVLFVEEVFDAIQRRSVPDETIQPIARQVFKIHVAEEARHIRYAREELTRTMPKVGRAGREALAVTIGIGLGLINRALTNPEVYADAGLDAHRAVAAANTSAHRREFLCSTVRRALPFFTDLGLVTPASRVLWRRAGFLP